MNRLIALIFLACSLHAAGPVRIAFDAQVVDWNNRCIATNYYVVDPTGPHLTSNQALNKTHALIASSVWMGGVRALGLYPGNILRANLFCGGSYGGTNGAGDDNFTWFLAPQVPLIIDAGTVHDDSPITRPKWKYQETGSGGGLGCVAIANPVYLSTGIGPNNVSAWINDVHLCSYMTTGGVEDRYFLGTTQDNTYANYMGLSVPWSGGQFAVFWPGSGALDTTDTNGTGFYLGTRTSSASTGIKMYRNGTLAATSTSSGGDPSTISQGIIVFGMNESGAPVRQTSHLSGGYAIGRSISTNIVVPYYNVWQQFETLLGRQK